MTILQDTFCQLPDFRRKRLETIRSIILKEFPDATQNMRYKMPTFEYHGAWLAIANRKNYISVYTCGKDHIATFQTRHPEIKCRMGRLNFRDTDTRHETALRDVIRRALTSNQGSAVKRAVKGAGQK